MMPTLNPRGDVCLLEHPSAALGRLGRGDVVVARSPAHARHVVCKRVLALAGDEVELGGPGAATRLARRGAAATTGDADSRAERGELGGFGGGAGGAPPSYASHAAGDPFGAPRRVRVPRGHVWLEGDNARNSTDSRAYGPVPAALLRGRVVARVWPPWEARWL
jgi:signal peptidase I